MKRMLLFAALAVTCVQTVQAQAPTPDEMKKIKEDIRKADLFSSITKSDIAGVNSALKSGADPNGRNWLDFSPLMWASMRGNQKVVDRLLAAGAKIDANSIYSNVVTIAVNGRHEDTALYLISKGGKPNEARIDGATTMMLAAADGQNRILASLLAKKFNPNQKDADGATALIYAARLGRTKSIAQLLDAGAKVDLADKHGRTPLMYAAANGYSETASLLIKRGAKVNLQDANKATALSLAARYSGDATVAKLLLAHGAKHNLKDATGKTAIDLASARQFSGVVSALRASGAVATTKQVDYVAPGSAQTAVKNSLALIQSSMKTFGQRARCTSCHHQGLGLMVMGAAKQSGFSIDEPLVGSIMKGFQDEGAETGKVLAHAQTMPEVLKLAPAADIGDFPIGSGYLFSGMKAIGIPANPGFAGASMALAHYQNADGSWSFGFNREPMQVSNAMVTALSLNVIDGYAPAEAAGMIAGVKAKAKGWLLNVKAKDAEESAARLLALGKAGASVEEIAKYAAELEKMQNKDGGWSQTPSMRSDAYVTGLAVYVLRTVAKLPATHSAIQTGASYLLRTQDEDGSWYVNKRCMPANTYMDAGFPHGESQYASFAGTAWATLALMQTMDVSKTASK